MATNLIIGFAIPINSAKTCTNEIITEGGNKKPLLGIIGLPVTREIGRYYGLPINRGVLITRIAGGSRAEESRMVDGYIILKISNKETRDIETLVNEVQKRKIDDSLRILV